MPLSDFVRYLNEQNAPSGSSRRPARPFVSENGHVVVHFAGLRLESLFAPVVAVDGGDLLGHSASVLTYGQRSGQPLEPEILFVLPGDDAEFIHLDRLVCTLHALNYLTYLDRRARGTLLVRVHPRHVVSQLADHGLVFEEILRACGLLPEQIVLEIEIDAGDDPAQLVQAVANYKCRGYGIAVGCFGRRAIDFALLAAIGPAIVRLDPLLVASTRPLAPIVEGVHALGARVLIEGSERADSVAGARASGFDFVQLPAAGPPARGARSVSRAQLA